MVVLSWEWDRVRRAGNVLEPQAIRGGRTLRDHLENRTCPGSPGWLGAEFGVSAPLISLFPPSPKKLLSLTFLGHSLHARAPDSRDLEMSRGGDIETISVGSRAVPC